VINTVGKKSGNEADKAEPQSISEIAAHYLDLVGGAGGTFYEFLQFTQNAGEPGGPASGGGAFWQNVTRTRPLTVDDGTGGGG
jgi:hypothetical protein